jgi:hypothetical protein
VDVEGALARSCVRGQELAQPVQAEHGVRVGEDGLEQLRHLDQPRTVRVDDAHQGYHSA